MSKRLHRQVLYINGFPSWSGEFSGPKGKRYGKHIGKRSRRIESKRLIRQYLKDFNAR